MGRNLVSAPRERKTKQQARNAGGNGDEHTPRAFACDARGGSPRWTKGDFSVQSFVRLGMLPLRGRAILIVCMIVCAVGGKTGL